MKAVGGEPAQYAKQSCTPDATFARHSLVVEAQSSGRAMLIDLAARIGLGSVVKWFLYHRAGATGLVFAAPLWGVLLAKPILELVPALVREAKRSAWGGRDTDAIAFGIHRPRIRYVAGYPWVVDEDLLAALGETSSDALPGRADPAQCAPLPDSALWGFPSAVSSTTAHRAGARMPTSCGCSSGARSSFLRAASGNGEMTPQQRTQ